MKVDQYVDDNGARYDYGHLNGKQPSKIRGIRLLGSYGPGEMRNMERRNVRVTKREETITTFND